MPELTVVSVHDISKIAQMQQSTTQSVFSCVCFLFYEATQRKVFLEGVHAVSAPYEVDVRDSSCGI